MKKILGSLPLGLLMVAMLPLLMGCSKSYDRHKAQQIVEKYDDTRELSKSDYAEAVDLCIIAMDDALDLFSKLAAESKDMDTAKFEKAFDQVTDKLEADYPYMDELSSILAQASEADMGAETFKKWRQANDRFNSESLKILEKATQNLE